MKISDYLNQLDKNSIDYISVTDLLSALSLPEEWLSDEDLPDLKCYGSDLKWYCTDSWVGLRFYFFRDELVAASFQKGRKWPQEFEFISKEKAIELRDYVIKVIQSKENITFEILDLNEDMARVEKYVEKYT